MASILNRKNTGFANTGYIYYGYELKRTRDEEKNKKIVSIATPENDDGSIVIESTSTMGGFSSQYIDFDASFRSERDLIRKYREISTVPQVALAIGDIVNESIVIEESEPPVVINLEHTKLNDSIKKQIQEEFDNILILLDFYGSGYEIFRRWYVDGKLYYDKIIDIDNPTNGILEVRPIDPMDMRKVREIIRERDPSGAEVVKEILEYYLYFRQNMGIVDSAIRISLDSITFVPSGIYNHEKKLTVGYLFNAIKPANQLRMMEDAVVIYRLSRAPERRVFYIDVGSLPKAKAEQYLQQQMARYRNKLVYNAETGEVRDDRRHMSMMEDFWLPRREGGKGTEITTLEGGQNLGEMQDVEYFKQKLYMSLNIPIGRLQSDTAFNLGKASEITRDELKFSKFISRLRSQFSELFYDLLKTQLTLKRIIEKDDWDGLRNNIRFDYRKDSFFTEFKEAELIQDRFNLLNTIEPYVGKYVSPRWVQKNVLRQSEDEISEIEKQNKEAKKKSPHMLPPDDEADSMDGGGIP